MGHDKVIRMVKVNVAQAKAELSALLDRAHEGEEIVVCKAGIPWARIVATSASEPRRPGAWRGLLSEKSLEALELPLSDEELDTWYK
jgi:prevent-host-death family protein